MILRLTSFVKRYNYEPFHLMTFTEYNVGNSEQIDNNNNKKKKKKSSLFLLIDLLLLLLRWGETVSLWNCGR
jgi:hypothetical protein